jgi:hypothetical protein
MMLTIQPNFSKQPWKVWKDERIFRIYLNGIPFPFPFALIVTTCGVPFSDALEVQHSRGQLKSELLFLRRPTLSHRALKYKNFLYH